MRVLESIVAPITADDDAIATSQTPGAAGNLTLNGVAVGTYPYALQTNGSLVGGSSFAAGNAQTSTRLEARFSSPRPVLITTVANESAKTITIFGRDRAGKDISESMTGPNATTGQTSKLFSAVYQIAVSAAFTGAVIAGFNADSYSRWIFIGSDSEHFTYKLRVYLVGTGTFDVQGTMMDINKSTSYTGGDQADDTITLAAAQVANYISDNDTPLTAVRIKVTAQNANVILRIIKAPVT